MKLTVFQSDKGDCLLLTGPGGEHILVDGGMPFSYRQHAAPALARLGRAGHALDLVYVSHIDRDHIGGVLQMMDDAVAWRRYDYQARRRNRRFRRPPFPRPPPVRAVWHNAFKDQVDDNSGAIEAQLVASMQLGNLTPGLVEPRLAEQAARQEALVTSIREGLMLTARLGRGQLDLPLNAEFDGRVIFVDQAPCRVPLGRLTLSIIGPARRDLEKLRGEWNKWLEANQAAVAAIRASSQAEAELGALSDGQLAQSSLRALGAELGRRNAVTAPNLASLMLLVEADGKRLLLGGDGHADDIIAGLQLNGTLDGDGRVHLDGLKLQHHGSRNNLHPAFCQAITADHYFICGNGGHGNPHPDALQALIDARLAATRGPAARPFKLWFNSSAGVTTPEHVEHMRAVQKQVRQAARRSRGRLRYRFLIQGSKFDVVL